jgi:hypothetical protein
MTFASPSGPVAASPLSRPILEPILEQLRQERSGTHSRLPSPLGPEDGASPPPEALRTSRLGGHARWYRENLLHCSEPMLQYEWAWMTGRLAALRHCRDVGEGGGDGGGDVAMACPPEGRLEALLSESQLFRTLLLQEFAARGLRPLPARGTVVPSEEAWEITSLSVRQEWGIQPLPGS